MNTKDTITELVNEVIKNSLIETEGQFNQILDGKWYDFKYGCDGLHHMREDLIHSITLLCQCPSEESRKKAIVKP
ncbi:MAG: hypothetical protein ACXABY_16810 [Candidatus Thorarchaeota archaeon]|jgi:hypothetical protein